MNALLAVGLVAGGVVIGIIIGGAVKEMRHKRRYGHIKPRAERRGL